MKAFFTGLTAADAAALVRTPAGRDLARIALHYARLPRHTPIQLRYQGLRWHVPDLLSWLWQALDIWVHQHYRFPDPPAAERPVILDLGANLGTASLWFARHFPQADLTAVEADPTIFQALHTNLSTNGFARVRTIQAAAWTHDHGVHFAAAGADTGSVQSGDPTASPAALAVPSLRVHDLVAQHPRVDLLKLDVEGAEAAILPDLAPLLPRIRHLFVEWHSYAGQPQDLAQLLALLQQAGFRYFLAARPDGKRRRHPLLALPQWTGMDGNVDVFAVRTQP